MTVKKESSGRRSVQAEAEVPGTPEEVWQAIATGPGISSWFVPSDVEEREGGVAVSHFGPGNSMDAVGKITAWSPPHRYTIETTQDGPGTVATQWIVEARSGNTCVVRVVHSWFANSDDWDDQFDGHTYGWLSFFRVLRLYLAHFSGRTGALFQLLGAADPPKEAVWRSLVDTLGFAGAAVGEKVRTRSDAPPLAGIVEWAGQPAWPEELIVRLEEPAAGLAHFVPHPMGDKIFLSLRFYLYGEQAAAGVARMEPAWRRWVNDRYTQASC